MARWAFEWGPETSIHPFSNILPTSAPVLSWPGSSGPPPLAAMITTLGDLWIGTLGPS